MLSITPASCPRVNAPAFTVAMHTVCGRDTWQQSERRSSHEFHSLLKSYRQPDQRNLIAAV